MFLSQAPALKHDFCWKEEKEEEGRREAVKRKKGRRVF